MLDTFVRTPNYRAFKFSFFYDNRKYIPSNTYKYDKSRKQTVNVKILLKKNKVVWVLFIQLDTINAAQKHVFEYFISNLTKKGSTRIPVIQICDVASSNNSSHHLCTHWISEVARDIFI